MEWNRGCVAAVLCLTLVVPLGGCGGGSSGGDGANFTPPHARAILTVLPQSPYRGVPVALNASNSFSDSGHTLSYAWTVVTAPSGSTAGIQGSGSSTTLTPDRAGNWEVRVTVSAGGATDSATRTFTVAENPPPVVVVDTKRFNGFSDTELVADASGSSDPAGQTLSYAWSMTDRPAGAATVPGSTAAEFRFTPDVDGSYTVSLSVSDGVNPPVVSEYVSTVFSVTAELAFTVIAADHHHVSDRLITISAGPNRAHVIDMSTGVATAIDLPAQPVSVAFAPDGAQAVVGHDGWMTVIDVDAANVVVTHPISVNANSVAHGGNGYVYAVPPGQWMRMHGVRIADGVEHESTGMSVRGGTIIRVHPTNEWIYGADRGLSPSDIEKYDISVDPAAYLYDSPYHGTYSMCGNLWLTQDGNRIITACGNTFRSSAVQSEDMTYTGALPLPDYPRITWATHSPAVGEIAVVAETGIGWSSDPTRYALLRFDDGYLNPISSSEIPAWSMGGQEHTVVPMITAYASAGGNLFVLANLESSNVAGHSLLFMRRP